MWGSWIGLALIGGLAFALLLGLVVLGSPIIAVIIAAIVGLGLLAAASMRRSREYTDRAEARTRSRDRADVAASREADRGAPAQAPGGELPPNPGAPERSERAGSGG